MTRLTVVRDELEDREVANFVPLTRLGFDVRIVAARSDTPYASTGLGLPLDWRLCARDLYRGFPGAHRVRRVIRRIGDPDRFFGLERAVTGSEWVSVMELHSPAAEQVCRLKTKGLVGRIMVSVYENIPFRYDEMQLEAERRDFVREAADLFVALTPAARAALLAEGVDSRRVVVQPNGVDAVRFSSSRRDEGLRDRWGLGDGELAVLYAGRLLGEKGLLNLVLAASRVRDVRFRLVFVGSGPEEPRLRRAIARAGLGNAVTFVPWVCHDQMPAVMASADVFAMPSLPTPYWEEQLGYSLIEAMASGVPVVATLGASIPFVVDSAGILVPPYDPAALSDALGELLRDHDLRDRLAVSGRDRVEQYLNTEAVAARLAALLSGSQGVPNV